MLFSEKTKVDSMDIRIFGGGGKVLGKSGSQTPKLPTSSPTTSQASQRSTDSSTYGEVILSSGDNCNLLSDSLVLPGGRTPGKKGVPKNKPVSQGGGAKFNPPKVKKVVEFDWTDSEDDEILANLSQSFENKSVIPNQSITCDIPDFSDDSDFENIGDDFCSDSLSNNKNKPEETSSNPGISESQADSDPFSKAIVSPADTRGAINYENSSTPVEIADDNNDVRAMLRKVWGQKFESNVPRKKIVTHGKMSGIASASGKPMKRSSDERLILTDDLKKRKLDNSSSSISKASEALVDSGNAKRRSTTNKSPVKKSSESIKITSPIEKLFDKMKEKGSVCGNSSTSGSIRDKNSSSSSSLGTSFTNTDHTKHSSSNLAMEDYNSGKISPCPICSKHVPTETINDHLDLCLTMQALAAE